MIRSLLILAVPVLLAQMLVAQPATVAPRVGVGLTKRTLTLAEAAELALKNNLEIEIERTSRLVADQNLKAAKGVFDPIFRWQPGGARVASPTPSALAPASGAFNETAINSNFALLQRLPWYGAQGSVAFDNTRAATNNPFSAFSPYLTSRLAFNYSQPLWRNFRIDSIRTDLKIRAKNAEIASTDLEARAIAVVAATEQAYWVLVAARADVKVASDFADLARTQFELSKRLIAAGTLAPVELAASEAELQRRVDTYFSAVNQWTAAENNLKTLIAPGRDSELWSDEIVPADTATQTPPPADALRESVSKAVAQRPELRALDQRTEINGYQRDLAANQRKPAVDVNASFITQGLAGTTNPAPNSFGNLNAATNARVDQLSRIAGLPPVQQPQFGGPNPVFLGGYGTVVSGLFGGNYATLQGGVTVDLNLRNRAADANLALADINDRRLKLQRRQVEQIIEAQVRNTLQAVETAKQRIIAATASVRAANEKLESENRLFRTGESTNFLVLTRQNELNDSRRRLLQAELELNRAILQFRQALGDTLAHYGFRVQ
jgi:outer membrane protein TolC